MKREMVEFMKKVLFGAFYALQGVGNLVFGLFFVKGGLGGGGFAMEILIKGFLVFSSCLSLSTTLTIFLMHESWTRFLGEVSSILLGAFYAWIAFGIIESIAFNAQQIVRQYYSVAMSLLLAVSIVVLNAIAAFSLHTGAEVSKTSKRFVYIRKT